MSWGDERLGKRSLLERAPTATQTGKSRRQITISGERISANPVPWARRLGYLKTCLSQPLRFRFRRRLFCLSLPPLYGGKDKWTAAVLYRDSGRLLCKPFSKAQM